MADGVVHGKAGTPGMPDEMHAVEVQSSADGFEIGEEVVERDRGRADGAGGVAGAALVVEDDAVLVGQFGDGEHMVVIETGAAVKNDDGPAATEGFVVQAGSVGFDDAMICLDVFGHKDTLPPAAGFALVLSGPLPCKYARRYSTARRGIWSSAKVLIGRRDQQKLAKNVSYAYDAGMVQTEELRIETRGNCHVINITDEVTGAVGRSGVTNGTATVFNVGSTAGITTTEFEPGLANHDLEAAFERIAAASARYEHEETWHDDNGHSHVRASLLGPSLVVPVVQGRLTLGTWQQIILIDFDTRARTRTVICQMCGE